AVDPNILNKIILQYNPDLFDESRMGRMLEHYVHILEAMVATPKEKIDHVNFLCDLEERLVSEMSRGEQSALSVKPCTHELFEAQVKRTPQSVAVIFEREKATYQDLNVRANQLAHYLSSLGVGREAPVAIFMEPSVEMVVSLLGVLKAGGLYVPLDPDYPAKRVLLMLEDSAAPVVLTQERLLKKLPSSNARVVCVDREWPMIVGQPCENPKPEITAENLAYLIYTSGSTGRPKGVEISHRALVNLLTSMAKEPGMEPDDVLLSVTPLSFDICALEIFLPLTVGAQVVLLPRSITTDGQLLRDRVDGGGATMMQATPMTWRMLIAAGWQGNARLKILCGGEALSKELADALLARGGLVYNLYGPTETTVWSTVWRVEPGGGSIVIGHPIDNTEIYVLDANLQPLPLGIEGDLFIGGLGVARGYRGNPSLTQEKFIRDPFTGKPAMRLFKTGDRARYLPDGSIEYLGRSDFQVKLRGYRIELGEIESVLTEHPAISQCIVVAKEEAAGEKQLVTYVVPVEKRKITQEELQGYLRERLPSYMVPTSCVVLTSLPLTPNGKVDRNALPSPTLQSKDADHKVLPRNRLELELVKIWQELLEVTPVGIRDNFFNLGGHSLLAIRLIAQIENLTGKNIPVATLFRAPTIEQLSAILQDENQLRSWSNLVPIQTGGSRTPFFLIHGESSNLFLPGYFGRDQPLFSLEHQSEDGQRALYTQVETIAAHYLDEIRTVQSQGPYLLGGYSFGGVIAFEIAQQLRRKNQEVGLLALIDTLSIGQRRSNSIFLKSRFTDGGKFFSGYVGKLQRWFAKNACLSVHEIPIRLLGDSARVFTNIVSERFQRIGKWFKRAVCKIYTKMEYPIPPKLRSTYILNMYRKAAQAYHPYPYPGRMIYFKSRHNSGDPRLSWGKLVGGEFKVYDVPGGHSDLRDGPFVSAWASILRNELDESMGKSCIEPSVDSPARPSENTALRPSQFTPYPPTELNLGLN
ncbi:MAG: amino acid adenylation domain protein, partial [Deltaproteobacteria bacterium]|nr:amino acid adenylation domain protein [Deltaproteobacteria bacterium]